ncbi:MAG: T9SS type A sorting domain-containing protein [Flavobacteriales bacterium]|nr:MAG: T9SS type A sorting domain-containing protein [Flavobacteriales bacterium]
MRRKYLALGTLLVAGSLTWSSTLRAQGETCITAAVVAPGVGIVADGPATGGGNSTVCNTGGTNADWYVFTTGTGGIINDINSCGGGGDTRVSVYNGNGGCGALTCLGSNDDFCDRGDGNFFASQVTNINVPAGTHYIEWDDRWEGTGFTWNFTFTPFACVQPAATVTLIPNCGGGTYDLEVNVTSLGSATSVGLDISVGTDITGISTTGIQTFTGIPLAATRSITLVHEQDGTCNVALGSFVDCCSASCADAVVVTSLGAQPATGTLYCSAGYNAACFAGPFASKWYVYTPPSDGLLSVKACPAGDTRLSLFDGTGGCGALTCLASNDDDNDLACQANGFASSVIDVPVTGGTPYYIQWDARWSTASVANWTVNFAACTPPAGTVTLIENCGGGTYDLQVDITSLGSSVDVDIDVTPGTDILNINATGIQLISGIPIGTVTNVVLRADDPLCDVDLGSFTDCCNGTCANAAVAVVGTNTTGALDCGAGASNAGGMGGVATDARWFTFAPPSTGQMTVSSCGSGIDTRVSIFTGPCGGQALVGANDDSGVCAFTLESNVANIPVTGGTTYYIEWDDRWSSTGFDWDLSYVSCTPPTATGSSTDNCGAGTFTVDVDVTSLGSSVELQIESDLNGIEVASVLATGIVSIPTAYTAGTPVTITLRSTSDANCSLVVGTFGDCCSGSCVGAVPASLGTNTNLAIDCGAGASNALATGAVNARWWTWTPASNGLAVVSACNPPNTTNFDTRVTVHTGTCGSLTLVGGDDDACTNPGFGSTFGWLANAGTTYYIEWDDRWDGTGHDWDLSLTPCVAPANDECSLENPSANQLNIGGSINYAGNANCANDELGIANIFGVTGYVWASFELMACSDVVIDYCGTTQFTTGALNMYTDCSGTNPVNSQSFNFTTCGDGNPSIFYNSLNPGVYYYPVLWAVSFPSPTYNINISASAPVVPCTPNICAVAEPITCGGAVSGTTVSNTATQGPSVCLPNHTAPGADAWYYVDALTSEVYNATTCLGTAYNSMITVYDGGASPGNCGALVCLTGNDDNCGVGTNTPSEVNWAAVAGNRYYIAVHGPSGFVNSTGAFTLNLTCAPATCPAPINDECGILATSLTPVLGDGSGLPVASTNCGAFADANPSCDVDLSFVPAAGRAQGVWFTFNTGVNEYMNLTLQDDDLGPYTATALSYALYSGTCGALVEVDCNNAGEGTNAFPQLTQNTDYYLMVHNQGGIGTEGTFGILLEFPAQNDAAVTAVLAPSGNLCTTTVAPQVTVLNNGQQPLTSLTVTYDLDGGTPVVTNLTFAPALTYGQSQNVNLTSSITTAGPHTLNVASSNPNGVLDEITSNDSNTGAFTVDGEAVQIVIVQDRWGSETTWEIYDALEIAPIASGGPYTDLGANGTANQVHNLCLPLTFGNCFTMRVIDAFGDGMCCLYGIGNWQVRSPNGDLLITDVFQGSGTLAGSSDNGGSNSPNANNPTYTGHEFCLPKGPSDIEAGECNVFNNTMNNKVYTTATAGTGNYMFEFLNPDFGYRRRISVPQRYVKFSQLQTQPLVAGTHYFVRARRDAGNDGFFNDNWGSGCDLALDPTQVPGCAQLIDDVDLPTHSCGVTRSFGYSDKVWSTPVLGATQYRFKFTGALDPDGPNGPLGPVNGDRVITQASYVRVLNWTNYALIEGETYNVQVEVLVSGTWSGYCGNVCTVTIDNPAFAGNNLNSATVNETGMALYPNPVRDGNVTLTLDGLTGEENVVTVDVFDVFGKRVFTQTIGTEGATAINTVLELGGQLASGMYMVDVTAGEQKFVQRLSIQ